jgi:hypothetical protein
MNPPAPVTKTRIVLAMCFSLDTVELHKVNYTGALRCSLLFPGEASFLPPWDVYCAETLRGRSYIRVVRERPPA